MSVSNHDSERIYNYITGIYCSLRYKWKEIEHIQYLLNRNRLILVVNLPILVQIRPEIELNTTLFQLKWHRNSMKNGLIKVVIEPENVNRLIRALNGEKSLTAK